MEYTPAVDGNFWRGIRFGVPVGLAIWLLIGYAISINFC